MDPGLVTNDVPEGMKDIIKKCLAKDRANRYSDAGELAGDLREILGFSPVGSTAGLSESKVKRVRSSPGAPPPVAPLAGPAIPASMAPTAAVRVSPPVGKLPEDAGSTVVPARPPMPAAAVPVADSESPTITTGRRMGEVMAKARRRRGAAPEKERPLAFRPGGRPSRGRSPSCSACSRSRRRVKKRSRELPPVPTSAPAASVPAPVPTQPPPAPKAPGATGASTAGPAVAVVETPARDASPTVAPTKKARVKPTAAPEEAAAAAAAVPHGAEAEGARAETRRPHGHDPPVSQDRRLAEPGARLSRRAVTSASPTTGTTPAAARSSRSTSRAPTGFACARRTIATCIVDLIVRSTATDDKVTIDRSLEKGSPDGPTGPAWLHEGKLKRPSYRTVRDAVFNVEPPDAMVSVNGREMGPASKFAKEDLQFADMAVYEVLLTAPGYESKSLRILVGPAAGEVRANIKEKLKKM